MLERHFYQLLRGAANDTTRFADISRILTGNSATQLRGLPARSAGDEISQREKRASEGLQMKILGCLVVVSWLLILPCDLSAHSGRTDSQGGHYNRSTGEYHFHHRAGARHPSADSDDDWRFIDDHPVITFIVGALVLGVFINLIERRGKRPV